MTEIRSVRRHESPPRWASLQRELFAAYDRAATVFADTYTTGDGRLIYHGRLGEPPDDRDGVDDFYESFFNWPQLYVMGGGRHLLDRSRQSWEGITAQLTEMGMLHDEYEKHYDWFHQGESLLLFTFLCLADPADSRFRDRAAKFADLFVSPDYGNYDPDNRVITAPHNGSLGPATGLTDGRPHYPWAASLAPYGLPLDWIDGVDSFDHAVSDDRVGALLGQEMWSRMGRGDTAVNLAATSLGLNAFLLSGSRVYADWLEDYTRAWAERAAQAGGILPDNAGLSGEVGEYLDGRWYGGHYGWAWPHGLHSVGTAGIIAACNAALLSPDNPLLDVMRATLDRVIENGMMLDPAAADMSMRGRWDVRYTGERADTVTFVVPYRHNDGGWHDFMPMQTALPTALWHFSGDPRDEARLRNLQHDSSHDWSEFFAFRDKEDAGHEEPWLAYLWGDNPSYPEQALAYAIEECTRRSAAVEADDPHLVTRIHHWQEHNPVSTEILAQLTLGAPQTLYNGGLLQARIRYWNAGDDRPGLPDGVAALVTRIDWDDTRVTLVNMSDSPRRLVIQGGAFAEHRFVEVVVDGVEVPQDGDARYLSVTLEPATTMELRLRLEPRSSAPTVGAPWAAVGGAQ